MRTQTSEKSVPISSVRRSRPGAGNVVRLHRPVPLATLATSLAAATISSFAFYYYGALSVYVFPKLFFNSASPTLGLLESLATFAVAYVARPIGAVLFGHVGDRRGRKPALAVSMLTMGFSTALIGVVPGYSVLGWIAPALLTACRFAQGLAFGGGWGGVMLMAIENGSSAADIRDPEPREHERQGSGWSGPGWHSSGWRSVFPLAGAPLGFLFAIGTVLLLSRALNANAFLDWGWRIPMVACAGLVSIASYVRWCLTETPDFRGIAIGGARVTLPLLTLFTRHPRAVLLGTVAATGLFVLFYTASVFYLQTVYALKWGGDISDLAQQQGTSLFLVILMVAMALMALTVMLSAALAARFGRGAVLVAATVATFGFGWTIGPLIGSGTVDGMLLFCFLGLALAGFYYGSLGMELVELFPAPVRYTGIALTLNLAGIFGSLVTAFITTSLVASYGLSAVGVYVSAAALVSLAAVVVLLST
jgi:MFS family permease